MTGLSPAGPLEAIRSRVADALGADAATRPFEPLPTLPRSVLMEQFDRVVTDPSLRLRSLERFVADSRPGELYEGCARVFSTSGASGVPGVFVYAPDEFTEWVARGISRLVRVGVTAATRLVASSRRRAHHEAAVRASPRDEKARA